MKTIGILGGSSDQATAEYYSRINKAVNARLGGWHTGQILIYSMDFATSEHFVRNNLWEEAAEYLADKAQRLERAGADLLICVSNTLHRVADRIASSVGIPFLHIADPTAAAICAAGLHRVALLGTKPVMSLDYLQRRYRDKFGIEILVPPEPEQDELDRIIFDELCRGVFTPSSKAAYLNAVDALHARGAQGVILGCTEIPLLIDQQDRPDVPMFNTLALHVEAAVQIALAP
ncbi:MAG TPA: aspartate/glutamate racemase family protein [Bryobacteraceae bacterium]|jgi:aspartate racemase|nr:aspartate/glutamate racemase family protein [Bryobacteraceae bacterium]